MGQTRARTRTVGLHGVLAKRLGHGQGPLLGRQVQRRFAFAVHAVAQKTALQQALQNVQLVVLRRGVHHGELGRRVEEARLDQG